MAQAEVRHNHREQTQNKYQRFIRQWQVLRKKFRTGTGQAHSGHHTGDEDQRGQEEAAHIAKGVLNIGMQDRGAVGVLIHQRATACAQFEQAEVDQRQAQTGDQARQHGIAGQQRRIFHATGAGRVHNHDAEDQGAQGIHGQITINETAGEGRTLIVGGRRNGSACRPEQRGHTEHGQGDNFQWRQEVAHGIQQFAGIERHANDQHEVDQAVDKQRQPAFTGQRGDPHLKRDRCGARGGKQRADSQIADGRQHDARHFANRGAERIHAAAHTSQRDHGHDGQADSRDQKAYCGSPDVFTRLNTNHGRENDVTRANEQGKCHKAQRENVLRS